MSNCQSKMMKKQRGVAFIELLIIIPLILFLALVIVEYTRALRASKLAVTLSREAVNYLYRECADLAQIPAASSPTCLNQIRTDLQNFAHALVDGTQIEVAIYLNEPGTSTVTSFIEPPSFVPQLTPTQINALATNHSVLAVSRSFVPYQPMIRFIPAYFFNFQISANAQGGFSDETVL